MRIQIKPDRQAMSAAAAAHGAEVLRETITRRGAARLVAATGASQLEFLAALTSIPGIDWRRVELFHLDEYVGIREDHRASFRRYLRENLIDRTGISKYHFLEAEQDVDTVRTRVGQELAREEVDVMFAGIGENGHLAFNDPPADFVTTEPYIVVKLDEACRRQQVGEGWFAKFEDVPETAISMSIQQILKARELLIVVPDARKAAAVKATLEGSIGPEVPASILRTHPNVTLYLDRAAASQLSPDTLKNLATHP